MRFLNALTLVGHFLSSAATNMLQTIVVEPFLKTSDLIIDKSLIYLGLFSRVVLMSGSALGPSAIARDADTFARHLAKAINCPNFVRTDSRSRSVIESINCLLFFFGHCKGQRSDGRLSPREERRRDNARRPQDTPTSDRFRADHRRDCSAFGAPAAHAGEDKRRLPEFCHQFYGKY